MPNCIYYLIREVHANLLQNMGRNLPKIYLKKVHFEFPIQTEKKLSQHEIAKLWCEGRGHFYLSLSNLIANCTLHNAYVIIYKLDLTSLKFRFKSLKCDKFSLFQVYEGDNRARIYHINNYYKLINDSDLVGFILCKLSWSW